MNHQNMTIGCITQLTEKGVEQTVDFFGQTIKRAVNVHAAQMEAGFRAKLIELGWTPPRDPAMTTTEEVPMPEPDVYRYDHWIDGPRQAWSSIRLDHSFTLPGVIGYVQGEPHFSLPKLRAYADARCAKLIASIPEWLCRSCRVVYPTPESISKCLCKECGGLLVPSSFNERRAESELDALAGKVKAMEDNDRRYRWLRDEATWTLTADEHGCKIACYLRGVTPAAIGPGNDDFDAAIDAASGDPC
jgi:hypothetical protein